MKLVYLFALLSLLGCAKTGSNESQIPLTPQNLAGAWELTSISANGMTVPAHLESSGSQFGYKEGFEKDQMQFSTKRMKKIGSDELSVGWVLELDYEIDGNHIVPKDDDHVHFPIDEVVSLTAQTLTIKGANSQPTNLRLNYTRIAESELATQKLQPLAQSQSLHLSSSEVQESKEIKSSFPVGDAPIGQHQTNMFCQYRRNSPRLSGSVYDFVRSADGTISSGAATDGVNFNLEPQFDFSKPNEVWKGAITGAPNMSGRLSLKNGSTAIFSLTNPGSCSIEIKRNKRFLEIAGHCMGVEVAGYKTPATLEFVENCILRF